MTICDKCKRREATIFITCCEAEGGKSRITRKRNLCAMCGQDDPETGVLLDANAELPQFPESYINQLQLIGEGMNFPDTPYAKFAYMFVMRGVVRASVAKLKREPETGLPRLTAMEALDGLRLEAIERLGGKVMEQLYAWGIRNCRDFGEILLTGTFGAALARMLAEGLTKEDFEGGYDFETAFPLGD